MKDYPEFKMIMKFFKKFWLHMLIWGALLIYFFFAPDLYALVFIKNGKPLQTDHGIPGESDRIKFVIDGLEPYIKDGQKLYRLYGWALIAPTADMPKGSFNREIILVSEERKYFFAAQPEYRNPGLPSLPAEADVDLDNLGFSLLIAEDVIKPGKYRIGIIFRDVSTGAAFYSDKPIHYLIKTPNSLRLQP